VCSKVAKVKKRKPAMIMRDGALLKRQRCWSGEDEGGMGEKNDDLSACKEKVLK
jgi:hypothetical protein